MLIESNSFAIKSSRVLTPSGITAGTFFIRNGRFVETPADQSEFSVTDFGDLLVSPGLIDTHVHINDPGTDWEGFESATAAAAAGGVTTLIDMPLNSIPVTTTGDALNKKRAAAIGKCHVDVGFYGGVVPGNESDLLELTEAGVFGLKAFLCHSGLDEFPAAGIAELRHALQTLHGSGVRLLAHAEIISASVPPAKASRSYADYMQSRPPAFELAAIEQLINLCREYQTPIHIVHLATAEALAMIAAAKQEGLPLTVETCPHYLYFCEQEIGDGETLFKCAPPIRDQSNRDQLREALADGLIDTIGSDHSPCPPELKRLDEGDFFTAWGGIAGLQMTLPVMATIAKAKQWELALLAEKLSSKPAELFGLENEKGKIASGFDADFVVWDPEAEFTLDADSLFHRHTLSPYVGRKFSGVVQQTFVRGQCVYDAVADPPHGHCRGQRLRFGAAREQIASFLNELDQTKHEVLETCCAAEAWVAGMIAQGDFVSDDDVLARAALVAAALTEQDWLDAFAAHPRIGDVNTLREKYANTKKLASGEQLGINQAGDTTLNRLAAANDDYYDKFGFIFIVCATGKSAAEMLELLEQRIANDRNRELEIAAAEQLKITLLRLRKLVQ